MTPTLTDGRYRLGHDPQLGLVLVDDWAAEAAEAVLSATSPYPDMTLALPDVGPYTGPTAAQADAIRSYLLGRYQQQYAEQLPAVIEEHLPPEGPPEGFPSGTAKHLAEAIVAAWLVKQPVHLAAQGFATLLAEMAEGAGHAGIAMAGVGGSTDDVALQRWAKRRASWALSMMDDTVGQEVGRFLTQQLQRTSEPDAVISAYHSRFTAPQESTTVQSKTDRAARSEARDAYNFGMLTTLQRLGVPRVLAHDASDGTDETTDLLCQQRNGQIYSVDEAIRQAATLTHPNDTLYFTPVPETSLDEDGDVDLGLHWSEAARAAARESRLRKHPVKQIARDTGYAHYLVKAAHGMDTETALGKLRSGELMDTHTWHRRNSAGGKTKLSAHRKSTHRTIVKKYLYGARSHANPEAIFTAGGGASGKSKLVTHLPTPEGHVYVNPDDIKRDLPEFDALAKAGRGDLAAGATHEESSSLSKELANQALSKKAHVVIDGVGDSGPKKFAQKILQAQEAGYGVHVRYAMTPLTQALDRAKKRYDGEVKTKGVGRYINEPELREAHKAVTERYVKAIKKLTGVHITIHNTSDDIGKNDVPPVIAEIPAGTDRIKVHDQKKYQAFLDKEHD